MGAFQSFVEGILGTQIVSKKDTVQKLGKYTAGISSLLSVIVSCIFAFAVWRANMHKALHYIPHLVILTHIMIISQVLFSTSSYGVKE